MRNQSNSGLTRNDLLCLICALGGLLCIYAPELLANKNSSSLASCSNNLRQMAQAFRMDAVENGNRFVWRSQRLPGYVTASPNAWENLFFVSNYVASPRILACPADTRMPASHFGDGPGGILKTGTGHNNSLSYFLGIDALPNYAKNILLGDRHLKTLRREGCSSVIPFSDVAMPMYETEARSGALKWGLGLHGSKAGNIARTDGSVVQATDKSLVEIVGESEGDGNNNNHVLPPY